MLPDPPDRACCQIATPGADREAGRYYRQSPTTRKDEVTREMQPVASPRPIAARNPA